MSESDGMECQRKASREIIHTKAEIMIDGVWHNCRVLNISTEGAKLRIDQHIDVGMLELLKIGKFGQFRTTFVWRQRDEIGVKFSHDASEMAGVIMGLAFCGGMDSPD
jgi:hypothetical protein